MKNIPFVSRYKNIHFGFARNAHTNTWSFVLMDKFNSNKIFILVFSVCGIVLAFRFADFEYRRSFEHRPWIGNTEHRCKMQNKWIYQLINLYWLDLASDFPSKSQCFCMNIQFYSKINSSEISLAPRTKPNRTDSNCYCQFIPPDKSLS